MRVGRDRRSSLSLRQSRDGLSYRLVYRYPSASPELRALYPGESLPGSITLGRFTSAGFRPSPRWWRALELPIVRDRLAEDLVAVYGSGGVYEREEGAGAEKDGDVLAAPDFLASFNGAAPARKS